MEESNVGPALDLVVTEVSKIDSTWEKKRLQSTSSPCTWSRLNLSVNSTLALLSSIVYIN